MPLPKEIWKNSEYKDPREFYNLSNEGYNSEFQSQIKKLRPVEVERHFKIQFSYFESISSFFRFVLPLIEWFSKFILFMHMHM
jgi:hypothetical protein